MFTQNQKFLFSIFVIDITRVRPVVLGVLKMNNNGFTFIEVLIAMCLLTIILFVITDIQLSIIQNNRERLKQTIAIGQLDSMITIMQTRVTNFSDFYQSWNQGNRRLLPRGQGEVINTSYYSIIRIYWDSVLSGEWHCQSRARSGMACLEFRVFL